MKVLHLIGGGDVGGARVHVLSLIKEMSRNIDVKLISFRSGMFADEALKMGIDIEIIRTGNFLNDLIKVISIVKKGNYQIIHSHGAKANITALLTRLFTGLPTVSTIHSDYRLDYLESILKTMTYGFFNTIALRFIRYYIGVSANFKKMLIDRRFNPNRIYTVYNGINFDQEIPRFERKAFAEKYHLNLKKDDIVVGILARLYPVKGLDTFIQAAALVIPQNPKVKFVIAGDGEERASLEKKVIDLNISDNVYFSGWIDNPYEFMSILDINVLTSISESFPYSILEGALLKKATISSNVGGISDLIESGVNGFLFEPRDEKTFARLILQMASDDSLREAFGQRLFEKGKACFSLENMGQTQIDIYKNILSNEALLAGDRGLVRKYLYDVVISGYYGSDNIGDDAILTTMIHDLRQLKKDVRVLVISRNPTKTAAQFNVESVLRINLPKLIWAMRHSRLYINGGGSLIQDIKSNRSILYYLGMIWIAKKVGCKVMVYANGIGPVKTPINRSLTEIVLNKVDIITLREDTSLQELRSMHVTRPKILLTADPALTLTPVDQNQIDKLFDIENIEPSGPYIGFSVRKWRDAARYERVIADLADYMIETYGIKAVFIPMQFPYDYQISENILSKMKNRAYVLRHPYNGEQITGVIGRMDLLVGMRLHALIFAAGLGVPIVGLEYEQKVESFLRYIHLDSRLYAGHVSSLDYDKLKKTVEYAWNNRASLKNDLIDSTIQLKALAFENARYAAELIRTGQDSLQSTGIEGGRNNA